MSAETSSIYLLDAATDAPVAADLLDAIGARQITDWKSQWKPFLDAVLAELRAREVPDHLLPQSSHWDWERKMAKVEEAIAFGGFSVVAQGVTQGMMSYDLNQSCRMEEQRRKPLVYVDYLEVAPWNRPAPSVVQRLRGTGKALMTAAVAFSGKEGFKGRIGLHSLPQSKGFYERGCGMTDLGPDAKYHDLRYFEMTAEQARAFLA